MNIVQCIRNRMCMNKRAVHDEQDLILYRQLRCAENKLYDARALLAGLLESKRTMQAAHVSTRHNDDASAQQERDCRLEELQKKIASMESDISRLEADYQQAHMNARTYFYLETSPGPHVQGEAAAGQPAQ